MTIRGQLRWDEGSIAGQVASGGSVELNYLLFSDGELNESGEPDSLTTAFTWLAENAPSEFFGLTLDEVSIPRRLADNRSESWTEIIWEATVTYKSADRQRQPPLTLQDGDEQEVRIHVQSGGGESKNVLYSKALRGEIFNEVEFSFKGTDAERMMGLRVDDDEDVGTLFVAEGVPYSLGIIEISVETLVRKTPQNAIFLANALRYAKRRAFNVNPWRGFAAGELSLVDVSWEQRVGSSADSDANTQPWEVNYRFEFEESLTAEQLNATLPPGLRQDGANFGDNAQWQVGKRGWDYLDVLWGAKVVQHPQNPNFKFSIPVAHRAAIHEVFDGIDFATVLRI